MDDEKQQIARIERELSPHDVDGHVPGTVGRREFLGTAAAIAATAATLTPSVAHAGKSLAAAPPAGFSPFNAPGPEAVLPRPMPSNAIPFGLCRGK